MPTVFKTEKEVYESLTRMFVPPQHAILRNVPDATGADKRRAIDALVMSLWPSRGLTLEAIEIKVSRSDLVRELKDGAKAEAIAKYCDRFWLAIGDAKIVQGLDIPPGWGLLAPGRQTNMKVIKPAPIQKKVKTMDREFLAAILRRATEAIDDPVTTAKHRAEAQAEAAGQMEALRAEVDVLRANQRDSARDLRDLKREQKRNELIALFEERSGVSFSSWSASQQYIERAADLVSGILGVGDRRIQVEVTMRTAEELVAACRAQLDMINTIEPKTPSSETP